MDLRSGFSRQFRGNPQQGTLFRAKAEELDPTGQRFMKIRGYTPERQREVSEAVGEVKFSDYPLQPRRGDIGPPPPNSPEFLSGEKKRALGEGAAVIRGAIARSTVPLDVVRDTGFTVAPKVGGNAVFLPGDREMVFARTPWDAEDHRTGFGSGYATPEAQRLDQGQTVIHELGHAADPNLEPLRGKRNTIVDRHGEKPVEGYPEPADRGSMEEFADDFAIEHFRHDPRARGRRQEFDVEVPTYPGSTPGSEPPQGLESYEKWGERSARAVRSLEPLWEQREGMPKTPNQRSYSAVLAAEESNLNPDLFNLDLEPRKELLR